MYQASFLATELRLEIDYREKKKTKTLKLNKMPLYNQEITAEIKKYREDMTGGLVVKNLPANAGDLGSIPGLGRFNVLLDSYVHLPQLQSSHATSTEPTPRNS